VLGARAGFVGEGSGAWGDLNSIEGTIAPTQGGKARRKAIELVGLIQYQTKGTRVNKIHDVLQ
jgi:hypothetical protein